MINMFLNALWRWLRRTDPDQFGRRFAGTMVFGGFYVEGIGTVSFPYRYLYDPRRRA
jgi:hypothetical protein